MADPRLVARARVEVSAGRSVGRRMAAGSTPAVLAGLLAGILDVAREAHGPRAAYELAAVAADDAARPLLTNRDGR